MNCFVNSNAFTKEAKTSMVEHLFNGPVGIRQALDINNRVVHDLYLGDGPESMKVMRLSEGVYDGIMSGWYVLIWDDIDLTSFVRRAIRL